MGWAVLGLCAVVVFGVILSWLMPRVRFNREQARIRKGEY
jgi:hypothetical protein